MNDTYTWEEDDLIITRSVDKKDVSDFAKIRSIIEQLKQESMSMVSKYENDEVIDLDADISNADWLKSMAFDFPSIKTTADYMQEFNINNQQEAQDHINEQKLLPIWNSTPKKIKAELTMYAQTGIMR